MNNSLQAWMIMTCFLSVFAYATMIKLSLDVDFDAKTILFLTKIRVVAKLRCPQRLRFQRPRQRLFQDVPLVGDITILTA